MPAKVTKFQARSKRRLRNVQQGVPAKDPITGEVVVHREFLDPIIIHGAGSPITEFVKGLFNKDDQEFTELAPLPTRRSNTAGDRIDIEQELGVFRGTTKQRTEQMAKRKRGK